MSNKRDFKKFTNQYTHALCSNMMAVSATVPGVDTAKIDDAIIKLLKGAEVAIMMADVKYDKTEAAFDNPAEYRKARRAFYKEVFDKAHQEFAKSELEAMAEFNQAIPKKG